MSYNLPLTRDLRTVKENRALEILNRLKDGQPLDNMDHQYGAVTAPRDPIKAVDAWMTDSLRRGPNAGFEVFWLEAPYGGGKTETLRKISGKLVSQSTSLKNKKAAVSMIDLNSSGAATDSAHLQSVICQNAMLTDTNSMRSDIDAYSRRLEQQTATGEAVGTWSGVTIDIALALAGVPVPAAGTIGQNVISRTWNSLVTYSESKIRNLLNAKELNGKPLTSPPCLELMTKWIRYSTCPTSATLKAFQDTVTQLALQETLFHAFCVCLEYADYSTLVILVDEGALLDGNRKLTRSFEELWNRRRSEDPLHHRLDIAFVFAVPIDLTKTFYNSALYEGFSRRFTGEGHERKQPIPLTQPAFDTQDDDLAHAIRVVKTLLGELPVESVPTLPTDAIDLLRRELAGRRSVTWHQLWSIVIDMYVATMARSRAA